MNKIKFTVITTTYNRVASGYLEQNIVAMQNQKGDNFEYEHIIVDDESTDETEAFVQKLAKKDKRIKYYHQLNAGPAKGVQNGLQKATGDFVIIVDDDDFLPEDSLQLRAEYIIKNPKIDFFYGLADWIDEYGLPIPAGFQSVEYSEHLYEQMLIGNCINGGTPTTRRTHLTTVVWPEWLQRSQDYFLWLELLRPEKMLNLGFINAPLLKYRFHQANYTAAIDSDEKKQAKAALNSKIKHLHNDDLVYLAEKARFWVDEAHRSNEYRLQQLKEKDARIDELQSAYEDYAHSRFVRYSVKVRNVLRGQVFDRIDRTTDRSKRLVRKAQHVMNAVSYQLVQNSPWKKHPLVTIVTPFYNREDTMHETVQSVLGQTFQDFEYIVVDDGSPSAAAQSYLDKLIHPKIKVIRRKNQGVAAARNTGVKKAKGKYIICLDSDDMLDPTYVEKSVTVLETNPNVSIVTYDMQMFGTKSEVFRHNNYDPYSLIDDNPVLTAAMFRKEVWQAVGGYKSGIGYEDWEFWVSAAEAGHFAIHIPEVLFYYRTAEVSRYVDDLANHRQHASYIRKMHPHFTSLVRKHLLAQKTVKVVEPSSAMVNLQQPNQYNAAVSNKKRTLVAVPWMTFGGAESLIYNFCKEIKNDIEFTFVTGIESPNEWEYKFREISSRIYHLAKLFDNDKLYLEFISNLIETRKIEVLHIIHSGYVFSMLEELKHRHPSLKVVVTLFNDRAEYFGQAVQVGQFIDTFTSDNAVVTDHFKHEVPEFSDVQTIPNGIDVTTTYNPIRYDREENRLDLNIKPGEYAVFFIGRLAEEKNPDVFVSAAKQAMAKYDNCKFFVIGDGPLRDVVEEAIGGTDKITYLGYKSSVAQYLSAADIFVLPSSIEGFPLSILEAMAMEVVPIASDVGAVSEIIDNGSNGYVVTPGSADEIVDAIDIIVKEGDSDIRKKAARDKAVENYSTEKLGRRYKELYRSR